MFFYNNVVLPVYKKLIINYIFMFLLDIFLWKKNTQFNDNTGKIGF